MSDITLSKAVRSNLLNLQNTAGLLSKAQERLSSGLRVNSALDNPTNYFTAQGLNSRANDLSQLADAVSNAVQTVAAADKGISAITKLVDRPNELRHRAAFAPYVMLMFLRRMSVQGGQAIGAKLDEARTQLAELARDSEDVRALLEFIDAGERPLLR